MKTISNNNKGFKPKKPLGTKSNPFVVTEAEPIITGSYLHPGTYVSWCGESLPFTTQGQLELMRYEVCPCCGIIYDLDEEGADNISPTGLD